MADRAYGEKHKDKPFHNGREKGWAKSHSVKTPFHFRDGVRVWVSLHDLTPDDSFL